MTDDQKKQTRARIGLRIYRLRTLKEWSQEELARRAGLQRSHVSRIEAGKYAVTLETVESIAEAFGMTVLAYNRSHSVKGASYVTLKELLQKSDIVSLHCPYTPETHQIINKDTIAQMKDGAILLNTARGGVINEEAVADALRSGKLRGAAVDVVSTEPIKETNPLYTAPNCIITPHMAWAPKESRQRIIDSMVKSLDGWLAGNPAHVVNM